MATVSSFSFSTAPKASAKALANIKTTDASIKQEQAKNKEPIRPDSPVSIMLDKQKAAAATKQEGDYFYTEDYLRMKAFEIRSRIVTYQNLGMSAQYAAAQQEGQMIVSQYQAYAAAEAAGSDPIAAARKAAQEYQKKSLTSTMPSTILSA